MEGIHLLRDLMRPNDWLGKIDSNVITSRSFSTGTLSAHRQTNCVYSSRFSRSLALTAPEEFETQSLSQVRPF